MYNHVIISPWKPWTGFVLDKTYRYYGILRKVPKIINYFLKIKCHESKNYGFIFERD